MKTLLLLLALSFTAAANVPRYLQTEWVLYRDAQTPLQGSPSGQWGWPGAAFSASTFQLYSNLGLALNTCRWAYSLNPDTGPSPTGIRLVTYDAGVVNELARVLIANRTTPTSGGHDLTAQLKALVAAGRATTIAMQTVGNGLTGPKVYHSVVECSWFLP